MHASLYAYIFQFHFEASFLTISHEIYDYLVNNSDWGDNVWTEVYPPVLVYNRMRREYNAKGYTERVENELDVLRRWNASVVYDFAVTDMYHRDYKYIHRVVRRATNPVVTDDMVAGRQAVTAWFLTYGLASCPHVEQAALLTLWTRSTGVTEAAASYIFHTNYMNNEDARHKEAGDHTIYHMLDDDYQYSREVARDASKIMEKAAEKCFTLFAGDWVLIPIFGFIHLPTTSIADTASLASEMVDEALREVDRERRRQLTEYGTDDYTSDE